MNLVKERNKRLLYIQTELNDLKRLDGYSNHEEYDHNDPEFAADEMPETIVQVCHRSLQQYAINAAQISCCYTRSMILRSASCPMSQRASRIY